MRIEQEILEDKLIFSQRTLPTGFLHWHEAVEICQMIAGEAEYTIGNRVYHFKEGDIITVQSRELHIFEAPNGNFVNISLIPVRELTYWMKSLPTLPTYISHEQIASIPSLEEQISQIFSQMKSEATGGQFYCEERLILLALSLWCLLARHFRTNTAIASKHRRLLQPILDEIDEDCSKEYTLASLANKLGYTPEYLSAIFRECVGMGFKEYLDSRRINQAKRLMLTTETSVVDIAQKCGYDNVRTFNNRFKALALMTPSEFIKHFR